VGDFTLKVNATTVTSGVQTGFNAGSYTVSETGPGGYASAISGDCAANGSITLALGDVKSCTVTNDDQPGTLTVRKVVVNDSLGIGTKTASDFSFSVNGGAPTPFEGDGENVLTVAAGAYTVSEPAVAGYGRSYNNCTGLVIPNGGSATCTITNTVGDANEDGVVDMGDVLYVELVIAGSVPPTPGSDANHDGVIDVADVLTILFMI